MSDRTGPESGEKDGSLTQRVVPNVVAGRYAAKFALAIGLVLVVLVAAGGATYVATENTVEEDAENRVKSSATLQANGAGEWISNVEAQTDSVSDASVLSDEDAAQPQQVRHVRNARDRLDGVASVHLVDTETGEIVASTEHDGGTDLESVDSRWTDEIRSGTEYNSYSTDRGAVTYEESSLSDHPVMWFSSPVPERTEYSIVVIGTLGEYVATADETDGSTQFVSGDGDLVLGVDVDGGEVTTTAGEVGGAADDEFAARTLESDEALFDDREDAAVGAAAVDLEDEGMVAIASIPAGDAYAVRDTVLRNLLVLVGASTVALVVVGTVLGRQTAGPLIDLRRKANRMEDGDLSVDLRSTRRDEIGQLYDGFDSMRSSLRRQIESAQQAREEAEAERRRTAELNEHLEAKADDYREVMRECADGDLTARMDPEGESEAMREIAAAFNEMVGELERTAADLIAFADEVATASEEVTASTEEVQAASQQVSESVQEISDGADRQHEQFRAVSGEMEDLSTTVEEIAAQSNQVADIAARTAETGKRGKAAAERAIDGLSRLETESEEAVDAIEALEAEMAQIDELIEFIGEVAHETNMLALNANIEASRASGSEEGFAVVADEVKELAAETKEAADDVEDRLERIDETARRTVREVKTTSERVSDHAGAVEEAADALDEIAGHAADTNAGVQEISAATEEQAATTEEVVAMVDEAATISEETTAETQTVAAAAEEQTTALTEVSQSASDLQTRADRLRTSLERFDVAVENAFEWNEATIDES